MTHKEIKEEIASIRQELSFQHRFDIALAAAFEPEEQGNTKWEFYENLETTVKHFGKKIFLPHRDLDWKNWNPGKIYAVTNKIVIPESELVLGYVGLQSTAAGIMLDSAYTNKVPIILLYEKEVTRYIKELNSIMSAVVDQIKFETENEAVSQLYSALRKFYPEA